MSSRLTYLVTIVLMASFISSCSKNVNKAEGLAGSWEWKSTDGGLAAHLNQTPATTGKTNQLKLTSSFQYFRYTDHVLTEEGTYSLSQRACIHDQKLKTVIQFSGSEQALMVENINQQDLVLLDENYDGVIIFYERRNSMDN